MARAKYHNAIAFVAANDCFLGLERVCQEPAVKLVAHVWKKEPVEVALLVIAARKKLKDVI